MPSYTIIEEVKYIIEGNSPADALQLFLNRPSAFLTGVLDRYMVDENGEDVDIMCEVTA